MTKFVWQSRLKVTLRKCTDASGLVELEFLSNNLNNYNQIC